jgi:uncharacterized protein (DUF983 family)
VKGKAMAHIHYHATENPMKTGILGRCPQCQQGHLFNGFLKLAPSCEVCGLDYSFADPADGPAFFAMTIVAVPALVFALWLQTTYEVPIWVHLFTTLPLTLLGSLALLRPLKGWLVCSQYFHKAEEGKLVRKGDI